MIHISGPSGNFLRKGPSGIFLIVGAASIALLMGLSSAPASAHAAPATPILASSELRLTENTASWAGYAVTVDKGHAVTDVKGTWVQPSFIGNCASNNFSMVVIWVGIDGFGDNTVEQIGTYVSCYDGAVTYGAWYEFYPSPMVFFQTTTIHPGDAITTQVSYAKSTGEFDLSIFDSTDGQGAGVVTTDTSAHLASAEWVVEAPTYSNEIVPLPDFGSVRWSHCQATVAGRTDSISRFPSGYVEWKITMVGENDRQEVKAATSNVWDSGYDFAVGWRTYGP